MIRISRSIAAVAGGLLLGMVLPLHAQTPSDGPPPNPCVKPVKFGPIDRNGPEGTRLAKRVEEYKVCSQKYSKDTGDKANALAAQSRAYGDAANKSIDEYNAFVAELNGPGADSGPSPTPTR